MANSDVDRIYLLIEDDVFPFKLPPKVETINVSDQPYFKHDGPNYKNGWTYMVLMRAALHRVFPKISRILSLDVDTIVAKDISELWDLPIDGNILTILGSIQTAVGIILILLVVFRSRLLKSFQER